MGEAARRSTASTAVSQGHVRSYLRIADYSYQRWRPCLATACLQTRRPIDLISYSHTAEDSYDTNLLYCQRAHVLMLKMELSREQTQTRYVPELPGVYDRVLKCKNAI